MKVAVTVTAILLALLMVTPAEANGASKKKKATRSASPARVIRVYEPRPAPPLAAFNLLGTNLVLWEDLDLDLYDDGEPLPPRVLRYRGLDRRVRVQTFDRYSRRKGQGY
jgi:hypothetical protein